MNKFLIVLFVIIFVTAGGTMYWFGFHEKDAESAAADIDTFIDYIAEEYYQENSTNPHDIKVILKQISDLSSIHAALKSYSSQNGGTYPSSLEELEPKYTPMDMFEDGRIPNDHDDEPFTYRVNVDRMSYTLCSDDLENGGRRCLNGGRN